MKKLIVSSLSIVYLKHPSTPIYEVN